MAWTVNKLAKLSGVSVRTLHYYDEIGLLKPAFIGDNNYRYYKDEQLLMLQQILFYRELGFALDDIKAILSSERFDKIKALSTHRQNLQNDRQRINNLLTTIDNTIAYLKGEQHVKLEEIFDGFTTEKQQHYLDYLQKSGVGDAVMKECEQKVKHWGKNQWLDNKRQADELYAEFVKAINAGQTPDSPAIQTLTRRHYDLTCQFWTPNHDTYIALGEMYRSHPDFVAFYDNLHPDLLDFLNAAMQIFAKQHLS